ncbi:flagellar motor protein MotB [Caenispirillum salinarum]|uniref:OmpA/MotB family protein n=1 Tax=Caenispirillum salinarum TaxID=859058 RepID=UPI00384E979C
MDDELSMHERGPAAWMVTFADLVILMLTFFVLLFSMTSMKTETWEAVSTAFSRTMQVDPAQPVNERSVEHSITARPVPIAMNLNYLAAVLEETLSTDPLLGRARIAMGGDRLVLALPADVLFAGADAGAAGRPVLSEAGAASLAQLGGVLASLRNRVAVTGHAAPTEQGQGPTAGLGGHTSGWELSMARAAAVADALTRAGLARPAVILGHGPTRSGALPADLSEAERHAFQRRVDVVIHQEADSR